MPRDLEADLEAAELDVAFSQEVVENAKRALAMDVERLVRVQEAIAKRDGTELREE